MENTTAPICPNCGGFIPNNHNPGAYIGALSRKDNKTMVCSTCGSEEALADFLGATLDKTFAYAEKTGTK